MAQNGDLGSKFGVSGYPTIKLFRNGQVAGAYEGARTADAIASYMIKQSGPSSVEVKTVEQAEKLLAGDDVVVFGFFAQDDALSKTFQRVAGANREDYKFAHTSALDVLNKFEFRSNIVLFQPQKLHNKLESARTIFQGAAKQADVEAFIAEKSVSLVSHVTKLNEDRFNAYATKHGLPVVYVLYDVDYAHNAKGTNYYRNRILKVAKEFEKKALFAVQSKTEFAQRVESFNGAKGDFAVGIESNGKRFVMPSEFSADNLKAFVASFLAGELKPSIKSEPVPASQGPVRVVVGENFDEEVLNNDDDVLIEFYAPWCGHCKNLVPIYDELGEKVKNEPKLRIAKIDATANEFDPRFKVSCDSGWGSWDVARRCSLCSYCSGARLPDHLLCTGQQQERACLVQR
jgi:protein disulfide-isomerase A3